MDRLYIVIPAYNEEDNIKDCVLEWLRVMRNCKVSEGSCLVIVNDGSKDGTSGIVHEIAEKNRDVCIIDKENGGHGAAVLTGYRYALANGADYVFQTDSDRQTEPKEFYAFWRQRKRFDVIIGRRHRRQDGLARTLVSKTLSCVIAGMFQTFIPDANTPFRLMKASVLREALAYVKKDEPLANVMISVVFKKLHARILFRDITFHARKKGVNTLNMNRIAKMGLGAVSDFMKLKRRF